MDMLNARLDELMCMMGKENAQQLATEKTLRKTQASLNTTADQQNPAPALALALAPASNPMMLSKPQTFDGTRGAAAEVFAGQIGLHAVTYPERFPTDASKVVFTVLFMKDYAATWSQPYLEKVFNREPVVFNDFLKNFRSSFFDHNCRHCAEVALWNLQYWKCVGLHAGL
ncbi:uncharacterized protein VP01_268g1 [Puccinia sorghi]|uniref:Retrotransposon gag domain-containing protein n=1 Tax=Puccinia sorghi TaxID=27349 RepID=A0A0L6V5L6_9BASI|nr:uncharacterized protein VP01_268g1 [Puccinia sorghi]